MRRAILVLATAALTVAGCSDDGSIPDPTVDLTGAPTETATPSPTAPATTPGPTGTETVAPTDTATPTGTTPTIPDEPTETVAPTTSEPTDDDTAATPFPANTETDTGEPSGERSTVADVRVGRHPGYDRVVFDADGGGTPGWTVGYVDEATAQGSGETIEVAGDAILEVVLDNTGYPGDTGVDEFAQDVVEGGDVVTEVHYVGVFEGQTQAFIGLEEERPFRARALDEGEGRVLVEIYD